MVAAKTNRSVPRAQIKDGEPAWDVALLFPTQGNWTEAEYLALENAGNRLVELSDGNIEILPMPVTLHQRIVGFLYALLHAFVESHDLGEVLMAPLPVRLWPGKMRAPDIAFFKPGRIEDPRQPPNGADLVVEVVSDDDESRKRDLETKRSEYAQARIAEYWIVDPKENVIVILGLKGKKYQELGRYALGTEARSTLLKGFLVSVSDVFAAGAGKRSGGHNGKK